MKEPSHTPQGWLNPQADQKPLQRFIETVRERIWLIVAAVAVTTAFAVLYVATADKVYEAEVQIVVNAVEDPDGALAGVGLLTQSNDPLRAIETASALIKTNAAAELAAAELNLDGSPSSILNKITIEPVAESDVLNITARSSTAEGAAALANGFAEAAITNRTKILHDRIDEELPILEKRLNLAPAGSVERDNAALVVNRLATLRAGSDPNLQIVEPALPPKSPASPRPVSSVIAGVFAGLIIGLGAAFARQVLDPRLRREEQLRARFRVPILARVPRENGPKHLPLRWDRLSGGGTEAYRTMRAALTRSARSSGSTSILITSPGPGEGKTTSAMSLAASLALTGKRVILIEGDLRRPAIGRSFGLSTTRGVTSVLAGEATLADSLLSTPIGGFDLWLLLAEEGSGESAAELLALPAAQDMVAEAKELADYVVVDSPPLATVADALPLARSADETVLVARLGSSRLDRIEALAELLADAGVRPTGFALIGVAPQADGYYTHARHSFGSPAVLRPASDGSREQPAEPVERA
jgi:capsular exopolysaccharide synthesis family protein